MGLLTVSFSSRPGSSRQSPLLDININYSSAKISRCLTGRLLHLSCLVLSSSPSSFPPATVPHKTNRGVGMQSQ